MSSKTKHLASAQAAHTTGAENRADSRYRESSLYTNAEVGKRQRPRYQARRRLARWDTVLLLAGAVIVGLVLGGAIWGELTTPRGTLAAAQTSYDFGDVPIGGGDITTKFQLTVQGDARAIDITSTWMCTKGRLVQADRQSAWFGMTHDGSTPAVNFDLKSGQPAYLEVKIDPAAHGPDAIGPIQRGVSVILAGGQVFTVDLTANVTRWPDARVIL